MLVELSRPPPEKQPISRESRTLYAVACELSESDPQRSIDHLWGAIIADPRNDFAIAELGRHEYSAGRLDNALSLWLRVADREPVSACNAATIFIERSEHSRAEVLLRRAVVIAPQCKNAWFLLAFVLEKLGLKDQSRIALQKFDAVK